MTVETPVAGDVTITESSTASVSPSGYSMFGFTVAITAPTASASDPLRITFEIDRSILPVGFTLDWVSMFRNGAIVRACSDDSGAADPDPCIASATFDADDDLVVTVLTSQASDWDAGVLESLLPVPLTVDAGGPHVALEGDPLILPAAAIGGTGAVSFEWTSDPLSLDDPNSPAPLVDTGLADDGVYLVTVTATDEAGAVATGDTTVEILNAPPLLADVEGPADPVALDTVVSVSAGFVDPGMRDTHTATIDWGDGIITHATVLETDGSGTASGEHAYSSAGIYTVAVTVVDDDGGEASTTYEYVVVYDPAAGFVTGAGWINSPAGAYVPDPGVAGKATFGFVSKYKKGKNVPDGQTEFRFKAAGLDFHSASYDWLVVTGNDYATFKGSGTVNGEGGYKFRIWAGDGDPDTFRIKIWEEDDAGNETVIYDNGFDQEIGGGSVVIHSSRK